MKMITTLALVAIGLAPLAAHGRGFGGGFHGGGGFGGGGFHAGGGGFGGGGFHAAGGGFAAGGGGYHAGGGYAAGGYHAGGYGGYHAAGGYNASGYRGSVSAGASRTAGTSRYGNSFAGGSYNKTIDGKNGGSMTFKGAGGVDVGPYGGVHAGGVHGAQYTGPNGQTYTHASGGHAGYGIGGYHAGGFSGSNLTTAGGQSFTRGAAGRVNVGPYGGASFSGGRGAFTTGPNGTAGWATHAGGVATPWGGAAVAGRGVVGINGTRYMSPTYMAGRAGYVRTGWYGYGPVFAGGWYGRYPGAWYPAGWAALAWWSTPMWGTVGSYCGCDSAPVSYDYGSTVVYDNSNVYVNGDQVATADQYADQAQQIADTGRTAMPAMEDQWQPLGVFGMVQEEEKVAQHIFQLAINKDGVIRGNYYDALADENTPVYGSVDKKTQRAAWSIGEKKTIVYEAGLSNLTKDECTVLAHFGKDRTQQMLLVRLQQPSDTPPAGADPAGQTGQ